MPTYRLTLEYDGTDFAGWQVQRDKRTAMGVLCEGLRRATGEDPVITAAGRTDAGAHAHGQVVGVSLGRDWDPGRLRGALNSGLPPDLAVVAADPADEGFDARRDAVDRTYRYVVVCRDGRSPVTRRHAWTVRGPLDIDAMRVAAGHLTGTHDLAAFGSSPRPGGHTVRTVREVTVEQSTVGRDQSGPSLDITIISVRADAFLRGMMRAFAGALVRVGRGRATPAWIAGLVDGPATRDSSVPVAPASGLHQWAVSYPRDDVPLGRYAA